MSKATRSPTTPRSRPAAPAATPAPLTVDATQAPSDDIDPAVPAAMALFRRIATSSADALLTEGEVNLDHRLLALCADALDRLTVARRTYEARRPCDCPRLADREAFQRWSDKDRADLASVSVLEGLSAPLLRAIAKLPARTPAGIYAKAQVCNASRTGSPVLAKSLARDLLACRALRSVLWPAEQEGGHDGIPLGTGHTAPEQGEA